MNKTEQIQFLKMDTAIKVLGDDIKVLQNKINGIENFLKKRFGEEL